MNYQKSFVLIVLLLTGSTIFAQDDKRLDADAENFFRIGAKAGVNMDKISGESYNQGFNFNYQLGVFAQFNFSRRFGLQPEVNFVQTSYSFADGPSDVYDDLFLDGSQKTAKLNYLEVPLLLNINVGESRHVKLQIGPSYNGLLHQTVDSLKNNANVYKNADWAAIGGLWIQLPFFNIGARYKIGLSNLNAVDNEETWKSQAIQVFAGITF